MVEWRERALRGEWVPWSDIVSAGAERDADWDRDHATMTARIVPTRDYLWTPNGVNDQGEQTYSRITVHNFLFKGANRGIVTEVVEEHVDTLHLAAQDRQADPRPVQERD